MVGSRAKFRKALWKDGVVNHHPVCGAKVGFADFLLMPQPPLLTRRGLVDSLHSTGIRRIFLSVPIVGLSERIDLRLDPEHHPNSAEAENEVREPGGDEWREAIYAAEFVEELKSRPIKDTDRDR